MLSLTQLTYIISVNKLHHFGRAAKECAVSQPSLSAQIHKAEEELGVILFDRSKSPVMTTDIGLKVVSQAKKVLKEHKNIYEFSQTKDEITGSFSLGVIPTISPYLVPLFIEKFSEKYPRVNLTISEQKTEDIVRMLHEDELDGGLLVTPLGDNQIIERSLYFEQFFAFISKSHPLYKKAKVNEKDLDADSVWLLDEGHCFRDQVMRICAFKKEKQILENVNFSSGNFETVLNLARRGHGYTLIPFLATHSLSTEEKRKNLKSFQNPVPTREVSLIHSRSFLKEDILQALEDVILENIPPELQSLKKGQFKVIDI